MSQHTLKFEVENYASKHIPTRATNGDVGYDLTLVSLIKQINDCTFMYDTGIHVKPPLGFYTEIVPRSSIYKTGFTLANNIGIIDPGYQGTLKVVVYRIVPNAPLFQLPFKGFQLIVRQAFYPEIEIVKSICDEETERGDGGFGSTSSIK